MDPNRSPSLPSSSSSSTPQICDSEPLYLLKFKIKSLESQLKSNEDLLVSYDKKFKDCLKAKSELEKEKKRNATAMEKFDSIAKEKEDLQEALKGMTFEIESLNTDGMQLLLDLDKYEKEATKCQEKNQELLHHLRKGRKNSGASSSHA